MRFENTRRIRFSRHAMNRIAEFGITPKKAWWLLANSEKESLHQHEYKQKKYGEKQDDVYYRRNGSIIFTCCDKYDEVTESMGTFVITVTDQQINIKQSDITNTKI